MYPPKRVVSLVPSLTESLFDLGLGEMVVGVTDYCVHPAEALANLPRIGGPKNPDVQKIINLKPDLVLANREENTRLSLSALVDAGVKVWVSFPRSVKQALEVLWGLADLFHSREAVMRLRTLETAVDWARHAYQERQKKRYFCPVWQDVSGNDTRWWMTFNHDTYAHDILAMVGGANIFADRDRRYPLEADLGLSDPQDIKGRDSRYPRVTQEEIISGNPEVILLPDEPYEFDHPHREEMLNLFADTKAVKDGLVYTVDGSLLTWHGTRLGRSLRELPDLFSNM